MKPLALRPTDISAVATALILIKRKRETEREKEREGGVTERGGRERETERVSNSGYICERKERPTDGDRDRQRQR